MGRQFHQKGFEFIIWFDGYKPYKQNAIAFQSWSAGKCSCVAGTSAIHGGRKTTPTFDATMNCGSGLLTAKYTGFLRTYHFTTSAGWHKWSASHHFLLQCAPLITTLRRYSRISFPANIDRLGVHRLGVSRDRNITAVAIDINGF
jgi:hypothetical protein